MNAVEYVLAQITKRNLQLTGKERERLFKRYQRDKLVQGKADARRLLALELDSRKIGM
jgi:hypothetical protein